jgi:putative nucleotidyltransferase with HDIG domain
MRVSLRARAFIVGTVALGVGVVAVAAVKAASAPLGTLALLGAAVAVTELFEVAGDDGSHDPIDAYTFSFSSGIHVAAILMLGPWAAALVAAFGVLGVDPLRGSPWRRVAFNASAFAIATLGAGFVFEAFGGTPGALDFPRDLLGVAGLAVVYGALNTVLVSCAVAFTSGTSAAALIRHSLVSERSAKASEAGLGAAIAFLGMSEPWAVVVLVPLLIATYQAHARLALLRRETSRALETFANIVDERDPYTYRHSARVADYVEELATRLGMSATDVARLRWAGRLHDLGKISVDAGVLRKPERLDEVEWAAMRRHPRLSARLLRRFRFASEEALAVEYHHERFDGRGYYGVGNDLLPLAAHFLTVADSFDAMTSDRPYRRGRSAEEALAEIERGSGTQYHPAVAAAFVAVQRGVDPLTVLAADQQAELRELHWGTRTSRVTSLRKLAARVELLPVAGIALALACAGLGAYTVAPAGAALAVGALAWRYVQLVRARRLTASLQARLEAPASRHELFDALVDELGNAADLRWAGLVIWQEADLAGSIEFERSTMRGPSPDALTSWLLREADADQDALETAGADLGTDGRYVALAVRSGGVVASYLVLGFGRSLPRHVSLALEASLEDVARTLPPVAAVFDLSEAVAVAS